MRVKKLALAVGVGLVVAGCAAEALPVPEPDAAESSPALTLEQNATVLAAVNAALDEATTELDPQLLAPRVTGPALAVRTSQVQVAAIRQSAELVTNIPGQYQQIILPTTDVWPRTTYAITQLPDPLETPVLIAVVQAAPREQYRLWGWVQLPPGIGSTPFTMPSFADPVLGSEPLAPDDKTLTVTPQDAVAQYADLITTGPGSAFSPAFAPAAEDQYRALLQSVADAWAPQLAQERVEGTYTLTASPLADTTVQAVRTADGGALVMAALDLTETITAVEGAVLPVITETQAALLQGQTVANALNGRYTDMIALYIPPAGSTDTIRLVGYSHVQTAAEAPAPPPPPPDEETGEQTGAG
jgi:hypothetical protein